MFDLSSTGLNTYYPKNVFTYSVDTTSGEDYGVSIDRWPIDAMDSNTVPSSGTISYPIDPSTIKVKFSLTGDSAGFNSPTIKNLMIIASDLSFD